MKKYLVLIAIFLITSLLHAQQAIDAGPDQVSVCESPVVLRASTYKGWAQMPAYGIEKTFPLYGIKFIDDNTGFVGALGTIYKTFDKGISWNSVYSGQTTYFYDFWFINKNTGFPVAYIALDGF